jgi:hypothetical protein
LAWLKVLMTKVSCPQPLTPSSWRLSVMGVEGAQGRTPAAPAPPSWSREQRGHQAVRRWSRRHLLGAV